MIIFVFAMIAVVVGFATGSVFIGGIVAAVLGAVMLLLLGIGRFCEWLTWRRAAKASLEIHAERDIT